MRDLVGWQQRQQVHLNAAQVETAFRRYDTRGEGRIAATDLRRAVELLGVRPDAPAAKAALDRYGGGVAPAGAARRGLNLEEFTTLVRDVVSYQEQQTAAGLATPDRVESAFRRFDTNNSGSIDARELAAALPQMGIPAHHVQAAMTKYGQGKQLDRAEFAHLTRDLIAAQQTEAALAAMTAEAYRTAFDRFDTDRSGTIDARELRRALDAMGVKHTRASWTS